jgi:sporulation protein YlmC with PRC-barrel domain
MPRKILLLAATLPLMLSAPVLAQTADQPPAAGTEVPPPPADVAPESTESAVPQPDTAAATDAAPAETVPLEDDTDAAAAAPSGSTEILTEESDNQVLAAKILGMDVVNSAGEKIGKVEDVLLDKSGQISGLVLKSGGVLGMGGKSVAVAWTDVAAAENAEAVTIDLTPEQIDAAPEFQTKEDQESEALSNMPPPATGPATPTPE